MELKKFISESLSQICQGIQEAKMMTKGAEGSCPIAPGKMSGNSTVKEYDVPTLFRTVPNNKKSEQCPENKKTTIL